MVVLKEIYNIPLPLSKSEFSLFFLILLRYNFSFGNQFDLLIKILTGVLQYYKVI